MFVTLGWSSPTWMPTRRSSRLCHAALVCSASASSHAVAPLTRQLQKPSWSDAAKSSCATCSWAAPWSPVGRCRKLCWKGQWLCFICVWYGGRTVSARTILCPTNSQICAVCISARFSAERPALSVAIYPLQHEDLPSVIRGIPLTLLDRMTLFQSHVAQPPHLSPLWRLQLRRDCCWK